MTFGADSAVALHARPQSRCIVCGPDHPHGLHVVYTVAPDGGVSGSWTPTADWEGFRAIIHGGIVSAVLDDAMSKSVAVLQCEALTGELRVRFRRHVAPGEKLQIREWVAARGKRLVETEATLTDLDGVERTHAWASFLTLRTGWRAFDTTSPQKRGTNENCSSNE